jgi:hypothetical protein
MRQRLLSAVIVNPQTGKETDITNAVCEMEITMDHFPFFAAEQAALIADITAQLTTAPINTPPPATAHTPPPQARRYHKHGPYMICDTCDLEISFCRCAQRAAAEKPSADDSAERSLGQRIADVRNCAGGR